MSRKPRLLCVLPATVFGGVERVVQSLLGALQRLEPVLLTQSALEPHFSELGIRTRYFDHLGLQNPYAYADPANVWHYAAAIRHVALEEQADVVWALLPAGTLFLSMARLQGLHTPAWGGLHSVLSAQFQAMGRTPSRLERWLIGHSPRLLQGLIVCSQGVGADLQQQFGVPDKRLRVIYNGYPLAQIRQAAQQICPLPKQEPWLLTACRLAAPKDLATVLHAFKSCAQQARLIVLGDGPQLSEWQALTQQLGLCERVTWAGFQSNPYPWIAQADICLLSSRTEGLSNFIIEAMALERTVLATDCPTGPSEIIQHQHNGYLVPVADVAAFAQALDELLHNSVLRQQLSQAGLQRAQAFALETMVQGYEDLWLQGLASTE